MKIVFDKPLSFEGKEYAELDLNLDGLTGQDMINADIEARILGDKTAMLEVSKTYQAIIAAKAAKVPVELIKTLPAKEFSRITGNVFNFLFS